MAVAVSVATTYAGTPTPADGTVSVLKAETTQVSAPAPVAATATACEEARVVKLSPWQVRRLNRVADRQEARDARKCCCDPCSCKDDCCKKTKTLILESRRKENCDCCK